VVQRSGKFVNCIRALRAPNHTEIESYPLPKLWKQEPENNLSWARDRPSQILMGNHSRSESLFYYFRLEDQVHA
jgi:hypothetical protein